MPRRPRIDLAGFHHIINRGVNRSDIFLQDEDYDIFLQIVCKACRNYRVIVHDYCIMSNHFHLLVETELENLSGFMKHINSNYAIYFNKKYKRSGHLWQGRFYSRYITSEEYFYTIIRYIEQNPVEAGIVNDIKEYPYTLASSLINKKEIILCAKDSKLIKELEYVNVQDIIGVKLNEDELKILNEIEHQKSMKKENKNTYAYSKNLKEHFHNVKTKSLRNLAIINALDDGYTQSQISNYLGLSKSLISKVVKSGNSTPDP